jgi:hypothetical protein
VTSLAKLLGHPVEMEEVSERVVQHFGAVFGLEVLAIQHSGVESKKLK